MKVCKQTLIRVCLRAHYVCNLSAAEGRQWEADQSLFTCSLRLQFKCCWKVARYPCNEGGHSTIIWTCILWSVEEYNSSLSKFFILVTYTYIIIVHKGVGRNYFLTFLKAYFLFSILYTVILYLILKTVVTLHLAATSILFCYTSLSLIINKYKKYSYFFNYLWHKTMTWMND